MEKENFFEYIIYILLFNTIIALILLLSFFLIRKLRKDSIIIFNKKNEFTVGKQHLIATTNPNTIHSFFKFISSSEDFVLFGDSNYEAFLYLYFHKKTIFLFLKMTPISLISFIVKEYNIDFIVSNNDLNQCITIIFSFVILFLLFYYLKEFYNKITKYYEKRESKTNALMISNINTMTALETRELIIRMLKKLNISECNSKVYVVPMTIKTIKGIYDEIEDFSFQIENYLHSNNIKNLNLRKNGILKNILSNEELKGFKFQNVNLLNTTTSLMLKQKMIKFYLNETEQKCIGVAFIVFKLNIDKIKFLEAENEFKKTKNSYLNKMNIKSIDITLAKHHQNIIWENLDNIYVYHKIRMVVITFILLFISFKILTPAAVYSYINPFLILITENISFLKKLVIAYSFTLIVALINSVIIPFGAYYLTIFERYWLKSDIEQSLLYKNLIAMIISTMLIPLFANIDYALLTWDYINDLMSKQYYYFIQYILQVSLVSNFIQFLAIPQSIFTIYYKYQAKNYFDFGYNYAYSLLIFFMVVCFSPLIQILPILGVLFFTTKYYTDKYNLCFVFTVDFDSGGKLSLRCLYIIFVSLFLLQLVSLVLVGFVIKLLLIILYILVDVVLLFKIITNEQRRKEEKASDFSFKKLQLNYLSTGMSSRFSNNETLLSRNSDICDKRDFCWDFIPPEYISEFYYNKRNSSIIYTLFQYI